MVIQSTIAKIMAPTIHNGLLTVKTVWPAVADGRLKSWRAPAGRVLLCTYRAMHPGSLFQNTPTGIRRYSTASIQLLRISSSLLHTVFRTRRLSPRSETISHYISNAIKAARNGKCSQDISMPSKTALYQ